MKTVSIHDAKTNLSKYVSAAKKGEKIYIGGFGRAEVLLTSIPGYELKNTKRNFTIGRGKITATPDAFSTSTDALVSNLMLDN
jgi:antitoxin (DNA-binding transcriptional repressor) of toxin-antitoxin stability system